MMKMRGLAFVLAVLCSACGDDDPSNPAEGEEDPSEHACEHAAESGAAVTASASLEDAPVLELSEEPSTVALVPGEAGYVGLASAEAALLFVGTADLVTGLFRDGEAVDLPEPAPNEECPAAIPEHFDLEGGSSYVLKLGPAGADSVWLMYTSAVGHGH